MRPTVVLKYKCVHLTLSTSQPGKRCDQAVSQARLGFSGQTLDEAVSKFNIASFSAGIGFLEQNESFRKLGREQIC